MKTAALVVAFLLVAAGFFALGRFTASGGGASSQAPAAEVASAPAPAVQAPRPPQPPPAPGQPPAIFRVEGDRPPPPPPPPPQYPVPPGTKPANDPSPAKGPATAKVIVLEVSDFQCPVCKRAYEPLRALADDFPGQVRMVFKQNPLDMHRNAWNAAAASMAAARQGKFDAYADLLFQNQGSLDEASLTRFAQQVGLDPAKFNKDYLDMSVRARAKAEGNAATQMGAAGTPSFFINGQMQVGWASYESIKQMVQREIQQVDGLMAQGKSLKDARIERVKANLADKAATFMASPLATEFNQP
jgi:protein-disulfide isomerase